MDNIILFIWEDEHDLKIIAVKKLVDTQSQKVTGTTHMLSSHFSKKSIYWINTKLIKRVLSI